MRRLIFCAGDAASVSIGDLGLLEIRLTTAQGFHGSHWSTMGGPRQLRANRIELQPVAS